MSLMDAPAYNEARERKKSLIIYGAAGLICVLFIGGWVAAGMPVDFPWNWWTHIRGRAVANEFMKDVEHNDLKKAYGVFIHDPTWEQHPNKDASYPFQKFQQDWAPNGEGNQFGAIHSHKIIAAKVSGNVLLIGFRFNNVKTETLTLAYDPKDHTLGFSPVELYLGD